MGYLGRRAGVRSTHLVQGAAASTCHSLPGSPNLPGKADPRTRKAVCSLVLCQEPQCPWQKGGWWEPPQHSPEGSLGVTGRRNKPHGNSNHSSRHSAPTADSGSGRSKNRRLSCPARGTAGCQPPQNPCWDPGTQRKASPKAEGRGLGGRSAGSALSGSETWVSITVPWLSAGRTGAARLPLLDSPAIPAPSYSLHLDPGSPLTFPALPLISDSCPCSHQPSPDPSTSRLPPLPLAEERRTTYSGLPLPKTKLHPPLPWPPPQATPASPSWPLKVIFPHNSSPHSSPASRPYFCAEVGPAEASDTASQCLLLGCQVQPLPGSLLPRALALRL